MRTALVVLVGSILLGQVAGKATCPPITASTAARTFTDIITGTGVMTASGTISIVMAPSAAAANTAQIGSYCIWY